MDGGAELKLVHVGASGAETVVKSTYGTSIFHSVDNGSSGLNGDGFNHVVGSADTLNGTVKIGFEDLKGGGDKDYDDSSLHSGTWHDQYCAPCQRSDESRRDNDKDVMTGGTGNDKMFGMSDDDTMDGGAGDDQIWGNSGDDVLDGGEGNDLLSGGKGDDVIADGDGNDTVLGNSGNDYFAAGEGNDSYDGGSGFDTIDYSGAKNGVSINLNAHVGSGFGSDKTKGIEQVIGSAFNDAIEGSKEANTLIGGFGNDTLRGRGGADTLTGGKGNDVFVWAKKDVLLGVDHITDFTQGDSLNLKDLLKSQKYSNIADVVKVTDTGAGSKVAVKVGASFVDVVILDGVHNTSAIELHKAGMILV